MKLIKIIGLLALTLVLSLGTIYAQSNIITTNLLVEGNCEMCKSRIEAAAMAEPGILAANWNVETKMLEIKHNYFISDIDALHQAIADEGHDTDKVKATDDVYEALHGCCKYRGEDELDIEYKAPTEIMGFIYGITAAGEFEPLWFAKAYWSGTNRGTSANEDGQFVLAKEAGDKNLVIQYVGYKRDTIDVSNGDSITVFLSNAVQLTHVNVVHRRKSIEISYLDPIKVLNIGQDELQKAACCNLSESFETNPAVDVSFTDAVTGTRQIEMLGLAGPNIQITREGLPDIRGLSALYGFTYIPGAWIDGIQLNLGTGSVVNGYESIAGQINVELKKPDQAEKLHVNLYANEEGRLEGNLINNIKVKEKLHTGILLHGMMHNRRTDVNDDGFMDMANHETLTGVNRWKWYGKNGYEGQAGVKVTTANIVSGQLEFEQDETSNNALWGVSNKTERYEGWFKSGKVFQNRPTSSLGFQLSGSYHKQDAMFGRRMYDANQKTFYTNLIYQGQMKTSAHKYMTGVNLIYDNVDELAHLNAEATTMLSAKREEIVPGAYFEYAYSYLDKFTMIAGLRGDYHNIYGFFATPRLHMRYAPTESTVFRLSGGRGQRTATILSENIGAFASNRTIILEQATPDSPYGLEPEIAWNSGVNVTHNFKLAGKEAVFGADAFYTHFQQQVVVDWDESAREVRFYNLDGNSTSKSFQTQLDIEVVSNVDLRLAYRFNDVMTTYKQGDLQKPLSARHRAFVNVRYKAPKNWDFDITANWQGQKRIPNTSTNPEEFKSLTESPDFTIVNTQLTKSWQDKKFQIYVGAENLLNYKQQDAIIASDNPSSEYFDASLVWGPIYGRNVYGGLRYTLK